MDNAELNMILSNRVESNDADVLEVFRKCSSAEHGGLVQSDHHHHHH
jgi:hypothetical protein